MSTVAILGRVTIDVLMLAGIDGDGRAWKWASHETIENLPQLEPIAREPRKPSLRIKVHPELGPVTQVIAALEAAGDRFEVLPFILGNGKLIGFFVLESMARTWQRTADDGSTIEAEYTLALREHRAPLTPGLGPLLGVVGIATPERVQPELVQISGDPAEVPLSEVARQ